MKNTLGDLNNHLFAQLEKLSDDDLSGDELDTEIRRSEAIAKVSERLSRQESCSLRRCSTWMNTDMTVHE